MDHRSASPDPEQDLRELINKWYLAFDGRQITVGTRCWPAVVDGVHVQGPDVWIQISHAEHPDESLVLHVARDTSVDAAVEATRARGALGQPGTTLHVPDHRPAHLVTA